MISISRRPKSSPGRKVGLTEKNWILSLRRNRRFGARRVKNELVRLHECQLGLEIIQTVLSSEGVSPLHRSKMSQVCRYEKAIRGERVQLDTMKVQNECVQYTAIDDCSRFLFEDLYQTWKNEHTIEFIESLLDAFAVLMQCIQTDQGREFMALDVQLRLGSLCIKYRPNRPGAPHLNGKVERVHRTMRDELYATLYGSMGFSDLRLLVLEWVQFYNYKRIRGSLGKTPIDVFCNKMWNAPFREEVCNRFDPTKERIHDPEYAFDLKLANLKRPKSSEPESDYD